MRCTIDQAKQYFRVVLQDEDITWEELKEKNPVLKELGMRSYDEYIYRIRDVAVILAKAYCSLVE